MIGFGLRFKNKLHISNLVRPYAEQIQLIKRLYNFGNKEYINSIAFVSGGGGRVYKEANEKGYEVGYGSCIFGGEVLKRD